MAAFTEDLNNTQETEGFMTTENTRRLFDFSVSDFATIVTTTAFVDKTLMIRDVYNASSRILITAPRRFGKSTNIDMVKRFFEIEVDVEGTPKDVHTTMNYKLFKGNNLEICKDDKFFNEHFGMHPVVHIDCKPLGGVTDFVKMLDAFKNIVEDSFSQHSYLLKDYDTKYLYRGITCFLENDFRKLVSDGLINDVDGVNLANSFKYLSTILNRHFNKKVFVLIDSYDAYFDGLLFRNNKDMEKIIFFLESSIGSLLKNKECVERVLITGVLPVIGEGFLFHANNIDCFYFLDNHPFTKYYGLTSADLDNVLSKLIKCDEERNNVKNTIDEYYTAYRSRNQGIEVYNVWSVLQYVFRRAVQSYWCERKYINNFRIYFSNPLIREKMEVLLLGNEFQLDISQPLSMTDVLKLNYRFRSVTVEYTSTEVELFFAFLYQFGYLSAINDLGRGVVCVIIPSEEIKYELAKAVFNENMTLYHYSEKDMNDIWSSIDAVKPDSPYLHGNLAIFRKNVHNWYVNTSFQFVNFQTQLFMNLVTRAKYSRIIGRKLGANGPTAILLKNKHQVAICVTSGFQTAESALRKAIYSSHGDICNVFNDLQGKVLIGIGLYTKNSKITIAYSYFFKEGDCLRVLKSVQ